MRRKLNKILKIMFLALLAIPGNAIAQDACEVYVFPTNKITSATRLGNYGLMTDLLAGQAAPEGMVFRDLPFDAQFEATKSIFAQHPRFANFTFLMADKVIDYKSATKSKTRLTASTAICYAELTLTDIVYSHYAISSRKIGVMPILREFTDNPGKPVITKMGGSSKLQVFPTTDVSLAEAAKQDLFVAFQGALQQAMDKFLKPKH